MSAADDVKTIPQVMDELIELAELVEQWLSETHDTLGDFTPIELTEKFPTLIGSLLSLSAAGAIPLTEEQGQRLRRAFDGLQDIRGRFEK